jgi:hypothetical protein
MDKTEDLVKSVRSDFDARREARRNIESKWLLNINFMLGNQYATIAPDGDVVDYGKRYLWQEREVYNHIAPIVEARLAKFTRVNCSVNVRPASSAENDVNTARLSVKLIESARLDNNIVEVQNLANFWSELTGTVFYKIMWNSKAGKPVLGGDKNSRPRYEGNVKITVCPPYEVYPDTLGAASLDACRSVIHARAYPVRTIEDIWGVKVEGGDVSIINMDAPENPINPAKNYRVESVVKCGYAIVIERYEAASAESPDGRLVIVAGDKLLYDGSLPYKNGTDGKRGFPFVRQCSLEQPAGFYGISIIERLIPVQRAYNAVKNRKHEFLNRMSAGIVAVEEGSVDTEGLEEDGLSPGKVLVYRQGANPPFIMSAGSVPAEFRDEEDRLLAEFVAISGVSNLVNATSLSSDTISGYALQLLIEQDYSRLSVTTEGIRNAARETSKQILRLFRQFARTERMINISGINGEPEILSFLGSDLTSDDIILEADSEMIETPAVRRSMVMDLLKNGILGDENGKLSNRNRAKIIEALGFGNWESAKSAEEAHLKKAALENEDLRKGKDPGIEEVDDHDIHIGEHTIFLVEGRDSLSDKAKEAINRHLREHKVLKRLSAAAESGEGKTI